MINSSFLAALLLGSGSFWAAASPLPRQAVLNSTQYDVVVVGGGPAGLSALSGLARVRRKALLIDSGEYRNGRTRHAHDIIGSDGVTPAYFRYVARQQISEYPTVAMQNGTVTGIQPVAVGDGTFFVTTDAEGNQYTSRKVVLGTGLMDLIPDTPGLQENWSQGIFWCPWCDGYEHRDQPLGLLGPLVKLPDAVEEIETLNADLIAFVNGTLTDANVAALDASHPQWESMLQTYNVTIENRTIASFERLQDGADVFSVADKAEYDQFLVTLDDGTQVERAAFLASFPWTQRSDLGQNLGVEIDSTGKMYANWTGGMETNIPGVYAVGDANSDDSTNVPHAMWSGKRAAVNMHVQMAAEDAESAMTLAGLNKRDLHISEENSLFDFIGRDLEDVWSREPYMPSRARL